MTQKCEKCGRWFKTKRGYNIHHSRMHKHGQESQKTTSLEFQDLKNKWNQLSLKFTILERKLKQLEQNGISNQHPDTNLDWDGSKNKPDIHRPERNTNTIQFIMVVKELEVIFTENFDYHDVLNPIEPRNMPEAIEQLQVAEV